MATTYADSLVVLGTGASFTKPKAGDTVTVAANWATSGSATFDFGSSGAVSASGNPTFNWGSGAQSFGGNVTIAGDLVVTGTSISTSSEQVSIADNYLYLNSGYTTNAAQAAGFVANTLPSATSSAVAGSAFSSTSIVNVADGSGFSTGDLIQVSNAANPENIGIYAVSSVASNAITIKTGTAPVYCQNAFVADSTVQGTVTKVSVSILRAGTDGMWEAAYGSTDSLTFTDLGGGSSLQSAYDGGATITTTGGTGQFTIAGDQTVQLTTSGGLVVGGSGSETNQSFFASLFSLSATGAVDLNSSGGAINIGNHSDAQNINIGTGGAARTLNIGTGAAAQTVVMGSTSSTSSTTVQAGSGNVVLASTSGQTRVTMADNTSLAFRVGESGAGDYIGVSTTNSSESVSIGNASVNASVTVNSGTGTLNVGTSASARSVNVGTGAAAQAVTVGSTSGASALTLQAGSGGLTLTSTTGLVALAVQDNQTSALTIKEGSNSYFSVDTTDAKENLNLYKFANLRAAAGVPLTTAEAVASGEVLYVASDGTVGLADADALGKTEPIGTAYYAANSAATVYAATVVGTLVPVKFGSAPASNANGSRVYLSATAGQGTLSVLSASGTVVYRLGILQGADGSTTTPLVLWRPQFIVNNP